MKPFILLALFLLSNSCDQKEDIGLLESNQNEEAILEQQLLGPNEIMLQIKILGTTETSKEICGSQKEHILAVEVIEILESGSSITNKLSKEQKLDVVFLFDPGQIETGVTIEAKAKESLCSDATITYFTIIGHKILE
ncbi:hypothetical protein [uncultured Allomuricauda sp.]|uniref:hypothetical protein n=1 Tax=Allomuricauda sp. R78024 TaxID=3093867 RepID=UPI0026325BEB|nr:hypothetical protein [uncultured Allomuricauda sp.]